MFFFFLFFFLTQVKQGYKQKHKKDTHPNCTLVKPKMHRKRQHMAPQQSFGAHGSVFSANHVMLQPTRSGAPRSPSAHLRAHGGGTCDPWKPSRDVGGVPSPSPTKEDKREKPEERVQDPRLCPSGPPGSILGSQFVHVLTAGETKMETQAHS